MKACAKCCLTLEECDFSYHKYSKDGLQYWCRTCDNEYKKKHYELNKKKYIDRANAKRKKNIEWFDDLKSKLKCCRCPETHPACLQFHHLDPSRKEMCVSTLVRRGWTKAKVEAEMEKCIVLCANCHFKEHWTKQSECRDEHSDDHGRDCGERS